jgi:hypothetical protein
MKRLISTIILIQLTFLNADNYSVSFEYMDGYASSDASSETIFQGVTSFSVEAWYKNPGIASGPNSGLTGAGAVTIISNYNRHSGGDPYNNFGLDNYSNYNPSTAGFVGFLGTISNERLDDDQWHHIAGVYDHNVGESYLYVDGVLNDSYTISGDFLSSSNKLYVNNTGLIAAVYYMECDIASVRITDGVRYSSDFTPEFPLASESNSIIALDFTTGSGTTVSDLSGNGNNFTLYDGAAWGADVPAVSSTPSNTHSLSFDGVDDYVRILDNETLQFESDFSLSVWYKLSILPENFQIMISKQGTGSPNAYGWMYGFSDGANWYTNVENQSGQSSIAGSSYPNIGSLNYWHNGVFVFEQNNTMTL